MKWVILLRGVNVGGKGKLPMKELREKLLAQKYCTHIETYIQSGNLVMESDLAKEQLESSVQTLIEKEFGFAPSVLAMRAQDFQATMDGNPFPLAVEEPKTLHLYFLGSAPSSPDIARLQKFKAESERYELKGKTFYLHAPDGIGRSKLAAVVEKALGVDCTARNWNTVKKLWEMLA